MRFAYILALAAAFSLSFADYNVRCHTGATDLVFVMDQSVSVGIANFYIGLDAAARLTEWLTVGTAETDNRVGFVSFDIAARVAFELTTYSTNAEVESAIRAVNYTAGDTNIAIGMASAISVFAKSLRANVQKLMIIITDGQDASDVATQHYLANALGIDTYAVGVGTVINANELIQATGDAQKVILVQDYASLYGAFSQICTAIADDNLQCYVGAIDLVFVMDQSVSVGINNFKIGLEAAANLTKRLTIGTAATDSRVGFVGFDIAAHVAFELTTYSTNAEVESAILAVTYTAGDIDIVIGMGSAISLFAKSLRANAQKLMIIITDGQDASDVATQHILADAIGIDTYAVGVGTVINANELIQATGDAQKVILVQNYASLYDAFSQICTAIGTTAAPATTTTTTRRTTTTTRASVAETTQKSSPSSWLKQHAPCGCDDSESNSFFDTWLDVIFIVDSSSEVSDDNMDNIRDILRTIGLNHPIGASNPGQPAGKYTRVGIVNTAENAYVVANLTTFRSGAELIKAAMHLKKLTGYFKPEAAISEAFNMWTREQRKDIRPVIVIFSSEIIDCSEKITQNVEVMKKVGIAVDNYEMCQKIAQFKDDNGVVISIAIALEDEEPPLINIADKCDSFTNKDMNMLEEVMTAICLANCYCVKPYTQFVVDDVCEKSAECLHVHSVTNSFRRATSVCAMEDGTLPDVRSNEKDLFLDGMHKASGFKEHWLGAEISGDTLVWQIGFNTSVTPGAGDYTNWRPSYVPDVSKPCLVANAKFDEKWGADADGTVEPAYYYSCQKEACSVLNYCL